MPIISHTSTYLMLSLKLLLISTTVVSAAVALKFSVPVVEDFAVYSVPLIYNGVVSWLRPPYLYLVINFIIITIVASSKLQCRKDDVSAAPPETMVSQVSQPVVAAKSAVGTDYPVFAEYTIKSGVVLEDLSPYDAKEDKLLTACQGSEMAPVVAVWEDEMSNNKENEYVNVEKFSSLSSNNSMDKNDSSEYSPANAKPPVSARFGHRRNVKTSPEGVKTVLGVSKPKRQDTLESTWKTITEGRAMPLTRHLRKSDTWERDSHGHHRLQQVKKTPQKKMTKAETFNDRTNTRSPSPGSSGGSGKLRKEPSLSQDELNRRVEAFIKKFNDDMRLQRQESFNQYKEMINRHAH